MAPRPPQIPNDDDDFEIDFGDDQGKRKDFKLQLFEQIKKKPDTTGNKLELKDLLTNKKASYD